MVTFDRNRPPIASATSSASNGRGNSGCASNGQGLTDRETAVAASSAYGLGKQSRGPVSACKYTSGVFHDNSAAMVSATT